MHFPSRKVQNSMEKPLCFSCFAMKEPIALCPLPKHGEIGVRSLLNHSSGRPRRGEGGINFKDDNRMLGISFPLLFELGICLFVLFFLQGLAPRVRTVRERQLQPSRQQTAGREGRRNVPITRLVLQAPRDSSKERRGEKRRAFRGRRLRGGALCRREFSMAGAFGTHGELAGQSEGCKAQPCRK